MLFGVEQRGELVDEITEYLRESLTQELENVHHIREEAARAIKKFQLYNLQQFNKHHKPAKSFQVGDLVVLRNVDTTAGVNKKLIAKYRGPYVIKRYLGNDRYEISDVENLQVTQIPYVSVVDSTRLRKWLERADDVNSRLSDSESNTAENELLED